MQNAKEETKIQINHKIIIEAAQEKHNIIK